MQKSVDIDLDTTAINKKEEFESLKPDLMKVFSEFLKKDKQIFDLTFTDPKTLTVSLIALKQDEERYLNNKIGDENFDINLSVEIKKNENLKQAGVGITKKPSTGEDILKWQPISGNTNLNFM